MTVAFFVFLPPILSALDNKALSIAKLVAMCKKLHNNGGLSMGLKPVSGMGFSSLGLWESAEKPPSQMGK